MKVTKITSMSSRTCVLCDRVITGFNEGHAEWCRFK
jgi:hypothetical protein